MPLATAQVQFSLLSRGPDQMTTQAVCRDLGITLIAYSPLGLGAPHPLAHVMHRGFLQCCATCVLQQSRLRRCGENILMFARGQQISAQCRRWLLT